MICPSCGTENRPGASFCNQCGAPLPLSLSPVPRSGEQPYSPSVGVTPGMSPQASRTNGLAIVSLILGIVSVPMLFFCSGGGILFGIAALITGWIARRQIKNSNGTQGGGGIALAGMIAGGAIGVLFGLVIFGLALLGPAIGNVFSNIIQEIGTPVP